MLIQNIQRRIRDASTNGNRINQSLSVRQRVTRSALIAPGPTSVCIPRVRLTDFRVTPVPPPLHLIPGRERRRLCRSVNVEETLRRPILEDPSDGNYVNQFTTEQNFAQRGERSGRFFCDLVEQGRRDEQRRHVI